MKDRLRLKNLAPIVHFVHSFDCPYTPVSCRCPSTIHREAEAEITEAIKFTSVNVFVLSGKIEFAPIDSRPTT